MIKELSAYLPYKLEAYVNDLYPKAELVGITRDMCLFNYFGKALTISNGKYKPILRPLSDLTKDEYWKLSGLDPKTNFGFWYGKRNGTSDKREYITYEGYSSRKYFLNEGVNQFTWKMMQFFFKHHFDVFGLIEQGKAISIHDK